MVEINKTVIGIAAGVIGTLFIGYCIYFDRKRRSDPDYKKKVRERRRRNRNNANASKSGIPNLDDHGAIERYFMQEIQLGETEIARGDFESGVEHLANAIVVCGQPTRLLQVLQTSLPHPVFAMLIRKMRDIGNTATSSNESTEGLRLTTASASVSGIPTADRVSEVIALDDLE